MQFTTFALAALSLGSAIAAPALPVDLPVGNLPVGNLPVAGLPGFEDALSAVSQVVDIVEKQVAVVEGIIKTHDETQIVGKVQESLITIGQNINGLFNPIHALGVSKEALSEEQLTNIPEFVENFQTIFVGVQTITKKIAGGISQESVQEVKPELQFVLASVGPVTRPVIGFVTTAVPGSSAILQQVTPIVAKLQTGLNTLVAPVNALLGGSLGGLL